MSVDYLNAAERSRLLDALFDNTSSFGTLMKKFKDSFQPSRFAAASCELCQMCKEFVAAAEGSGLIGALYVVDCMRKQDCVAAKSALYDILIELERAIRRDMFLLEHIKYTAKDAKEGKKSAEATRSEMFRIHCAAKVFAFQLLGDSVSEDEKVVSYASKKQESIDEALNAWEKASIKIKEPMSDIEHCWVSEREKQRCGSLYGTAAVYDEQPTKSLALLLPSVTAKLPMLPIQEGELQYLLPGKSEMLLLESAPPSDIWLKAKKILAAARKAKLLEEEEDSLLALLDESLVSRLGVSPQLVSDLATHNPEVCATLLTKVPSSFASPWVQVLLKGNIPEENMQTILLRASKVLKPINVVTFMSNMILKFKNRSVASSSVVDSLRSFVVTLDQLVGDVKKTNPDFTVASSVKTDLQHLCESCNSAEIKDRWVSMTL